MEKELEAAEALLELRNGVEFSWSWGRKRRRSAEEAQPSPLRRFITTPLWAHGPVKPAKQDEEEKAKPEAASFSPDTPLCFSPGSDSSHENIPTRRLKLSINNNNNNNNNNNREVKNAKHLRKLKSTKISKARKLEIINETMKTKEKSEIMLGADDILSQRDSVKPNPIIDDTRDLIPREPIDEEEVPFIDIDLNALHPLEYFPPNCWDGSNLYLLDQVGFRRAMAAQARQRRMLIFRANKSKRGL